MLSPGKVSLKSYLTLTEYQYVGEQAKKVKISISMFVKKACLGQEIRSKVDQEALLALAQATADLGRLGGLLKKGLSEHPDFNALRVLLKSVEQTKTVLKRRFEDVAAGLLNEE